MKNGYLDPVSETEQQEKTDEQKKKWDQSQKNEMTIRIDQRNKIQQLKKMEVDAYDILKHVRIKNENEHQWEKELNKEVLRQKKFTLLIK